MGALAWGDMSQSLPFLMDPDDPRAPTEEQWAGMSDKERARVVAMLPSEVEQKRERAEQERERAEQERERAEQERERAEQERDEALRKLALVEAELAKLRER